MKLSELKPGDQFSLTKRKNATVYQVHPTAERAVDKIEGSRYKMSEQVYEKLNGKYVVICHDCRQLILDDQEIFKK